MSYLRDALKHKRGLENTSKSNNTHYFIDDKTRLRIVSSQHKDLVLHLSASNNNPLVWNVDLDDNFHKLADKILVSFDMKNIPNNDQPEVNNHVKNLIEFLESFKFFNYCFVCAGILDLPSGHFMSCDDEKCNNMCNCLLLDDSVTNEFSRYKGSKNNVIMDFIIETAYLACGSSRRDVIYSPVPSYFQEYATKKGVSLWTVFDNFRARWTLKDLLKACKNNDSDQDLYRDIGDLGYAFVKFAIKSNNTLIYQGNLFSSQDIANACGGQEIKEEDANAIANQLSGLVQFSVQHPPSVESKFKKADETCYLYHGSGAENWYSILRNGLQSGSEKGKTTKFFRNGQAYGSGIYLSDAVNLSMGYSQGSKIIIAVYQVMGKASKWRKAGNIFVVPDSKNVLLKYLLVFPGSKSHGRYGYGSIEGNVANILNEKFKSGVKEEQKIKKGSVSNKRVKRLMREYQRLSQADPDELGFRLKLTDGNSLDCWTVYIHDFEGNPNIENDMKKYGIKEVELEFHFPDNFPFGPPFVRIVSPRFCYRTGHVTMGGSICMELLTNQGWDATTSIPAVVTYVKSAILDGEGQIDPKGYNKSYGIQEARTAYDRMLKTHGWV